MENFARQIVTYITAHPDMALLIIAGTAFGESFAFLSLLFPGTMILIAAGALVKAHAIGFVAAAAAGSLGAILGDAVSFWIGRQFGHLVPGLWPFRKHPEGLQQGIDFFQRFGWMSVFIGRFFGPLRAIIPLAAGTLKMPVIPFYIANVVSAVIWAPALLLSGYLMDSAASSRMSFENKLSLLALAAILIFALGAGLRRWLKLR